MRRRKPRVVWLPSSNAARIDSATTDLSSFQRAVHTAPSATIGDQGTTVIALVNDIPPDAQAPGTSLADVESSGYRLRRVVGNLFIGSVQAALDDGGIWACTAGIICLRVDSLAGIPLSTNILEYNPQIAPNDDSPWVWRRTWILSNQVTTSPVVTFSGFQFPFVGNNTLGGNVDGSHVDQKTARVLSKDMRLFLVIATTCLNISTNGQGPAGVFDVLTDLRVLASLMTNSGNRRNAAR